MAREEPVRNGAIHIPEFAREKMIGARHDDERGRSANFFRQRVQQGLQGHWRAELIVFSLDKKARLAAGGQEGEIGIGNGRAQTDEFGDARIGASGAQSHAATKTEAGDEQRESGKLGGQEIESRAEVALLPAAVIVRALAQARAAEIEAQSWNPEKVKRAGDLEDDFVVHGAAEERVRMADDGGNRRIRVNRRPEQGFQAARGAGNKESAAGVHVSHGRRDESS